MLFDAARRRVVSETIRDVCEHRGWDLLAMNVRTNHVHVVVAAQALPERMMTALKSWTTRRMAEAGVLGPSGRPRSRHGSTRYLWTEQQLTDACRYVLDAHGGSLDGRPAATYGLVR